ncbi:MAG: RNA 2',3'-cyclic phosphodiesterase [Acidobacteriota bacterium]
MSTPRDVRAFVALELAPEVRRAIAELIASLRPRVPGARWVRPDGVHLTLRFLGDTPPARIEQLRPALAGAASACEPFEARLSALGTFPGPGKPPRVLWLGIQVPPPGLALQAACERAAVAAGFPPEGRPFRGHLTLARFRERVLRPALPPADLGAVRLEILSLLRSDLRPGGAVYTPIDRFPLGGAE